MNFSNAALLMAILFFAAFPSRADSFPVSVSFFPGVPQSGRGEKFDGLRLGLPVSAESAKTNGAEASLASSNSNSVNGAQLSLVANKAASSVSGVQASGVFNDAQAVHGLQASLINCVDYCDDVLSPCGSVQLGVVNIGANAFLQLGAVNWMESGAAPCQFGLLNYIEGNTIPVMPVFNFRF